MRNKPFLRLWGIPLFLAVLTLFGLLSALLGSGSWQVLSWIALSAPLAILTWCSLVRR